MREIIGERLKAESMSFDDGVDLYNLATVAAVEAKAPNAKGEFKLLSLLALGRSLDGIPFDNRERAPHRDWVKAHKQEIVFSEPSADWLVRSDLFWNLEQVYHTSPIADRIAWEAAENPLPGECESDEVCRFLYFKNTEGEFCAFIRTGCTPPKLLRAWLRYCPQKN